MENKKIILKEYFCEHCNKQIIQKIELQLGLSSKSEYKNEYCLKCDARLRKDDIKEIRTDFDCPLCKSFIHSGFATICNGCGEILTRISLDTNMFKLPKEEFKKQLVALLESLTEFKEPENKHEVEINKFVCPFCKHEETIKVSEHIWNEKTKGWEGIGIDYWECPNCGEENDIGLENFEEDFKSFKKYTEKNDWVGLKNFCTNSRFDDFMLYSLARYYIQNQEFEKSLNIAKILIEINPKDICSEELIKKAEKGLRSIKKTKNEK